MAFGNGMGVKIEHNLDPRDFFAPGFGDIILEVPDGKVGELSITYTVIGEVTADGKFSYGNTVITVDEAENAWKGTLEKVFKTVTKRQLTEMRSFIVQTASMYARTKLQNLVYLFLYSLEQTASMTAHVHLSVQVQRWM